MVSRVSVLCLTHSSTKLLLLLFILCHLISSFVPGEITMATGSWCPRIMHTFKYVIKCLDRCHVARCCVSGGRFNSLTTSAEGVFKKVCLNACIHKENYVLYKCYKWRLYNIISPKNRNADRSPHTEHGLQNCAVWLIFSQCRLC